MLAINALRQCDRPARSVEGEGQRRAIQGARLILTPSDRTTADVVRYTGAQVERVRTIRYGANPVWAPSTEQERRDARNFFGLPLNRPMVVFVGGNCAAHARRGDFVELNVEQLEQVAGLRSSGDVVQQLQRRLDTSGEELV